MKYFKKVERGKIYLSPVNPDDYETIAQWMNDPKVTKELALHTRIASLEKEKNRLENIVKNGDYIFAIVKQENDEFIGTIGIHDIDALNQHAEIGISIGKSDEHGKGYGADALNAVLSFGFHTLNLYNMHLRVYNFNTKALKCYEKVGFKKVGEAHHTVYRDGEWFDESFMEFLKPDREEKNK